MNNGLTLFNSPASCETALVADSKETLACAFLSAALLVDLGANYLFGFWQADSIVCLIIVAFLFRKGWESWRESGEED